MRARRTLVVAALLGLSVASVGLGGCAGTGKGAASRAGETATFAVGRRFETFVDTSRPTDAKGEAPAQPTRTLETAIWYPADGRAGGEARGDAPAATARGPFPLVVFSHGSGISSPVRYELVLREWAAAGFVVAAPKHPLSSTSLPDAAADVVNQPADVSFVIDQMLRLNADGASPFGRLIDPGRLAVAGHSLGALTALAVGFNACCADSRLKAGIVLAGGLYGFPDDGWFRGIRTPILVVHGDDDRIVRIAEGQRVFEQAPPPKAMLTVFGGDHNRPYGGSLATTENVERQGATLNGPTRTVNTTAIAFLDQYVKGRSDALQRVARALADDPSVKLQVVAG